MLTLVVGAQIVVTDSVNGTRGCHHRWLLCDWWLPMSTQIHSQHPLQSSFAFNPQLLKLSDERGRDALVVLLHQNANSCQRLCAGTLAAVPQPLFAAAPKATGLVLAAQARQSPPRPIVPLAPPRRRAVLLSCTPCRHPPRVPQDSSLRCLPPARRPPCGARTAESSRVAACSDRHGATHHRLTDRFGLYRRRA